LLLQQQRQEAEEQLRRQQHEEDQQRQLQQYQAAVTLQCVVRCYLARRLHASLAVSAGAQQHAIVTPICSDCTCPSISASPSTCSRASDSSTSASSSRGSSRPCSGSTVCSSGDPTGSDSGPVKQQGEISCQQEGPGQQQQQLQEGHATQEALLVELPGLVIRHAAETRTAAHDKEGPGRDCKQELAKQLVQRAGQLVVCEGQQAADLATRTLMASSSSRQLQSALQVVRAARPTM
jgi:hypothetical protein